MASPGGRRSRRGPGPPAAGPPRPSPPGRSRSPARSSRTTLREVIDEELGRLAAAATGPGRPVRHRGAAVPGGGPRAGHPGGHPVEPAGRRPPDPGRPAGPPGRHAAGRRARGAADGRARQAVSPTLAAATVEAAVEPVFPSVLAEGVMTAMHFAKLLRVAVAVFALATVVVGGMTLLADGPADKDARSIEGEWSLVAVEDAGKPLPTDQLKGVTVTIKDGKMTVSDNNMTVAIRLDSSVRPHVIDITRPGPERGRRSASTSWTATHSGSAGRPRRRPPGRRCSGPRRPAAASSSS